MSRVLKASLININNSDSIIIDNTLIQYQNNNIDTNDDNSVESIEQEIINTAREQADIIIKNAKEEAKKIIAEAESLAQSKIEEANLLFEQQKEKGYEDGIFSAKEEAKKIVDDSKAILEEANLKKLKIQEELQPELINLVLDISHNILTQNFTINPDIISLLIKKGLQNVKQISNLNVIVSEQQFEFVSNNLQQIINIDLEKNNINVLKDSSLKNSDCNIESDFGTIKCGLDEQFDGIKNAFSLILKN